MTDRYAFLVEWLDPQASLIRTYMLYYFPGDNTIEMDDLKNRRKFLRRCPNDQVSADLLVVGGTIVVHGRQLNVVAYGDDATRNALGSRVEHTLAMIKPNAFDRAPEIIEALEGAGLKINKLRSLQMSLAQAREFYAEHDGKPFFGALTQFMSSGPIVAMELFGEGAIAAWRKLIGPTNSDTARQEAPGSIRARFGEDGTRNAAHGSDSVSSADREVDFFFGGQQFGQTAAPDGALAVFKPHLLVDGRAGSALCALRDRSGLALTGLVAHNLNRANAGEFLEVYDGVLPSFSKHVEELSCGVCLCAAFSGGADAVERLRAAAGPHDPELARLLRPDTVRAKFGADVVRNGLHVTDLPEDGQLEIDYVFRIL